MRSERPTAGIGSFPAVACERVAEIRSAASKLTFPALMEQVNRGLTEPMAFDAEFRSLQNVCNCLEHHGGRVGTKDVDPVTGIHTLSFPRLQTFYKRGDEEVELLPGETIDTHAPDNPFGKEEVTVYLRTGYAHTRLCVRRTGRHRRYRLLRNRDGVPPVRRRLSLEAPELECARCRNQRADPGRLIIHRVAVHGVGRNSASRVPPRPWVLVTASARAATDSSAASGHEVLLVSL